MDTYSEELFQSFFSIPSASNAEKSTQNRVDGSSQAMCIIGMTT